MRGTRRGRVSAAIAALVLVALQPTTHGDTARAIEDEWALTLLAPNGSLCVGQSTMLTGQYHPGPGANDGLAPLSGPTISLSASGGSVDQAHVFTGAPSGTFTFVFKAEKPGTARVYAMVPNDAEAAISVKVREKCEYRYTFQMQWTGVSDVADVVIELGFQIKSGSTLRVTDPTRPQHLEATMRTIHGSFDVRKFKVPECRLLTPSLGKGTGYLDATADIDESTGDVTVRLGQPDFEVTLTEGLECRNDEDSIRIQKSLLLALKPENDPWVSLTFPAWGGTKSTHVDTADRWTRNWLKGRYNSAGYTATVTLERIIK